MGEFLLGSALGLALRADAGDERPLDLTGIGLLLSLAGVLLLGNAVLFRHPRSLVADFLGADRRLSSLREHLFRRVQVTLGFLLLLPGFALQLYGHYRAREQGAEGAGGGSLPWLVVGGLALVLVALEFGLWLGSRALYRRYLREHFLEHPPELESDLALARELGELFGVSSQETDSVQSYLFRIRQRLGLPVRLKREDRRVPELEVEEEYEPSP